VTDDDPLLPPPARRRQLGTSGVEVGAIAYGCWRFAGADVTGARRRVDAALDAGIDLFDHADIYGCDDGLGVGAAEELFGKVLAGDRSLRDRMVIATKAGIDPGVPYDSSAAHLRRSCDDSLRRLGIDVIDLWQIHRPDPLTHPEVVAEVVDGLVAAGKIRHFGLSNHTPAQSDALAAHLTVPIVSQQPEFSAARPDPLDDGVLDWCLRTGAGVLAWSPLAGGALCRPLDELRATPGAERTAAAAAELQRVADVQGARRDDVALAWLLAHPAGVVPIVGSTRPERIAASTAAFDVRLSRRDWFVIWAAGRGEALP
jgi:aryl-alcohol dehydrogenase-like predicted oxidoreductase